MSRRILIVITLMIVGVIAITASPRDTDPVPISLARVKGAAYQASLKRFFDGEGIVCQPFQLDIRYDRQPDFTRNVIAAEQSDDVVVAQTPSVLYVFYNKLALNNFDSWIAYPGDANPLLCNTNVPLCAAEMKRLAESGTRMLRICGRVRP